MTRSPCYECGRRYPNCHAECKDYEEYNRDREGVRKERQTQGMVRAYVKTQVHKTKCSRGEKWKGGNQYRDDR